MRERRNYILDPVYQLNHRPSLEPIASWCYSTKKTKKGRDERKRVSREKEKEPLRVFFKTEEEEKEV